MKKFFLLLIATASLSLAFDYNLKPKKVAEETWCFLGNLDMPKKENGAFMSNFCYVKTTKGYVVIDSGSNYNLAKQSYERMAKIEKLPVVKVLNTHGHDDHWLGNSFFKESFNSEIIGTSSINEQVELGYKTRVFNVLSKEQIKNTKLIKLDKVITEATNIKVGQKEFMMIPVGVKAHTSEDLFVYVPQDKILFTGDLVMNGRVTSNRDGSVIGSLKALEMIQSKKWDTLIPGHGFDTSKTAIDETLEYFTLLKQRVLEAVEEDIGAANVNSVVKLEEFKDKALYDELNSRNIFDAYGELEFYEE
ncbi:MBL fold metallo-hydrolase [Arcobacter sp. YIC-464]|uniref:MBL fold metallo-hydrolase n=1 Tax=Arcobacter sp. YIC-464 TaxID=3376631 RepID=UPI003C1C1ADE